MIIQSWIILGPSMLVVAVVALVVGILQAVTQIQEQTLSYLPKLIALSLVVGFTGYWMFDHLVTLAKTLFDSIPGMLS